MLAEICVWQVSRKLCLQPIYVFTPTTPVERLARELVRELMREYLARVDIVTEDPEVIVQTTSSVTESVNALLKEARAFSADLIILSSRGGRAGERFAWGSFAERLLRASELPLLCLNQVMRPEQARFARTLFATDFSTTSEYGFDHLLHTFAPFVSEIVLFHDTAWEGEFSYAKRELVGLTAERWVARARDCGLIARYAPIKDGNALSKNILRAARQHGAGSITMTSEVGPFNALMFGSHARDMIRASEFPLVVFGPKALR